MNILTIAKAQEEATVEQLNQLSFRSRRSKHRQPP